MRDMEHANYVKLLWHTYTEYHRIWFAWLFTHHGQIDEYRIHEDQLYSIICLFLIRLRRHIELSILIHKSYMQIEH